MDETVQKWVIAATSIMLGMGILGAVIMVVASKKKNSGADYNRPYPIRGREIVQVTALPVISYALVLLAVTGQLNEGILAIFATIAGFVLGKEQASKND